MKCPELTAAIKNKSQVFIITGDDYMVRRAATTIRNMISPKSQKEMNIDVLENPTSSKIVGCLSIQPFMSTHRLVYVDGIAEKELTGLESYISNPIKTSKLVVVAESVDGRTKFASACKKAGFLIKLEKPKDSELPSFVQEEAKRLGVNLASGVAHRIVGIVGTDLASLSDAVVRCGLWGDIGSLITSADTEIVLSASSADSVFTLTDAIGSGDLKTSVSVLENLIANREEPIVIVAMIAAHIKKLWVAGSCSDSGSVASTLGGIHPFYAGKLFNQAKSIGQSKLSVMHDHAYLAEKAIRGGRRLDPRIILEEFVVNVSKGR